MKKLARDEQKAAPAPRDAAGGRDAARAPRGDEVDGKRDGQERLQPGLVDCQAGGRPAGAVQKRGGDAAVQDAMAVGVAVVRDQPAPGASVRLAHVEGKADQPLGAGLVLDHAPSHFATHPADSAMKRSRWWSLSPNRASAAIRRRAMGASSYSSVIPMPP